MTEFWLISAPGEKTCQQTWEKLCAATTKNNNLSTNAKFNIPDLKVCWSVWSVLQHLVLLFKLCLYLKLGTGEVLRSPWWGWSYKYDMHVLLKNIRPLVWISILKEIIADYFSLQCSSLQLENLRNSSFNPLQELQLFLKIQRKIQIH